MASKVLLFMVEALGAMTEGGAVGIGTAGERKVQRRKKEDTRRRECHPDTTTTTTCSSLSSFTSRRFSSLISFLVSSPSSLSLSFNISILTHSFHRSYLFPPFHGIFIRTLSLSLSLLCIKLPPGFVK